MAEKTHKPTEKRLRDARKQGEVVRSRELTALGVFLALWIYLGLAANFVARGLTRIVERAIVASAAGNVSTSGPGSGGVSGWSWLPAVQGLVHDLLWTLLPVLGIAAASAILISGAQTRGLVSWATIQPRFDRINPGQGLRNLFSRRNLIELARMLIKIVLLLATLGYAVIASLSTLVKLVYAPAADLLGLASVLVWRLMGWAALVYVVGAVLDYASQFYEFMRRHRMSIEELRREHLETEGNPQVKGRRRTIAQEALATSVAARIGSATVVVVAPADVAVALYYSSQEATLPRVIAKGKDVSAARIRSKAERDGVPVLEDAALAQKLFRDIPTDHYINDELFDGVAAAIRWARQVDRREPQPGSDSPR